MKRLASVLIFSVMCMTSHAHQSNLSGFTLSASEQGTYRIKMSGSLTGFESAINTAYGKNSFKTPDAFKALVVSHLEKNVTLKINEKDISLKGFKVILGHETKVFAEAVGVPKEVQSITLKNTFFKRIPHNKMLVTFSGDNLPKKRYVLGKNNYHTLDVSYKKVK